MYRTFFENRRLRVCLIRINITAKFYSKSTSDAKRMPSSAMKLVLNCFEELESSLGQFMMPERGWHGRCLDQLRTRILCKFWTTFHPIWWSRTGSLNKMIVRHKFDMRSFFCLENNISLLIFILDRGKNYNFFVVYVNTTFCTLNQDKTFSNITTFLGTPTINVM